MVFILTLSLMVGGRGGGGGRVNMSLSTPYTPYMFPRTLKKKLISVRAIDSYTMFRKNWQISIIDTSYKIYKTSRTNYTWHLVCLGLRYRKVSYRGAGLIFPQSSYRLTWAERGPRLVFLISENVITFHPYFWSTGYQIRYTRLYNTLSKNMRKLEKYISIHSFITLNDRFAIN